MKRFLFVILFFLVSLSAIGQDVTVLSNGTDTVHIINTQHFEPTVEFDSIVKYSNNTGLPVLYCPVEGESYVRFNTTYVALAGIFEGSIPGVVCEFEYFREIGVYDLPHWYPSGLSDFYFSMLLSQATDLADQNYQLMGWAFEPENRMEQIQAILSFEVDYGAPEIVLQARAQYDDILEYGSAVLITGARGKLIIDWLLDDGWNIM